MIAPAQLVADFPRLSHSARIQAVVGWALDHRAHPDLAAALDELTGLSTYHAGLVVDAARAIDDLPRLRQLAAHPSTAVRMRAWQILPLAEVSPGDYLEMPISLRRRLVSRLHREERTDVIAQLLKLELSDQERASLLAGAPPEELAAYLPDLADLVNVAAVGRRCPDLVLVQLRRRIAGAPPTVRDAGWAWVAPALKYLVLHNPTEVLQLLTTDGPSSVIPPVLSRHLGRLLRHDPKATIALLTRSPWAAGFEGRPSIRLVRNLRRSLHHLNHDDRVTFARAHVHDNFRFAAILEALPPSQRASLFHDALAGIQISTKQWAPQLLEVLPRQLREAEARRMAGLPSNNTVMGQLQLAGYRHPDEARQIALPSRRATDAEERATALAALVLTAARSRDIGEISQALRLCDEIIKEQDPVKLAVVEAIETIPISLLAQADVAPLNRLTKACSDARDSSWSTMTA